MYFLYLDDGCDSKPKIYFSRDVSCNFENGNFGPFENQLSSPDPVWEISDFFSFNSWLAGANKTSESAIS